MKAGTLRNLLIESKKLNHIIASTGAVGLVPESTEESGRPGQSTIRSTAQVLELVLDHEVTVIRFPNVDLLIDFLRRSA